MSRSVSSASVYNAVASPVRRAILERLVSGEQPVQALVDLFKITQPAISQHLKILHDAGLVLVKKVGQMRLYRVNVQPLKEVYDWVAHYERFWDKKLDSLGNYLEKMP